MKYLYRFYIITLLLLGSIILPQDSWATACHEDCVCSYETGTERVDVTAQVKATQSEWKDSGIVVNEGDPVSLIVTGDILVCPYKTEAFEAIQGCGAGYGDMTYDTYENNYAPPSNWGRWSDWDFKSDGSTKTLKNQSKCDETIWSARNHTWFPSHHRYKAGSNISVYVEGNYTWCGDSGDCGEETGAASGLQGWRPIGQLLQARGIASGYTSSGDEVAISPSGTLFPEDGNNPKKDLTQRSSGQFYGTVGDCGAENCRLEFRHYNANASADLNVTSSLYWDNYGGYTVYIDNSPECVKSNGEYLEYKVGDGDAKEFKGSSANFTAESTGTISFRINDPDGDYRKAVYGNEVEPSDNNSRYYNNYQSGDNKSKYTVTAVIYRSNSTIYSDFINLIVQPIKNQMYSITQVMFENFVGQGPTSTAVLVNTIRIVLVLWIIFYGIAFMFGMVEQTQMDFLYRIVKFSVVVTLISPGAWNTFNTYFFTLFREGADYIISVVSTLHIPDGPGGGPHPNFSFLDDTFGAFFSSATWKKLASLLVMPPVGWIALIMIIIAMGFFIAGVAQAIIIYIMAIIAVSLLIVVSPLFITFVLFQHTKNLFEGWFKLLLSFSFQPILVFTSLALFNLFLIAFLHKMLNFSACWDCALFVDLTKVGNTVTNVLDVFIPAFCLFTFYVPWFEGGGIPDFFFIDVILFTLFATLLIPFNGFVINMAGVLFSSVGDVQPAVSSSSESLKSVVGMDQESKARRAKKRREEREGTGDKKGKSSTGSGGASSRMDELRRTRNNESELESGLDPDRD